MADRKRFPKSLEVAISPISAAFYGNKAAADRFSVTASIVCGESFIPLRTGPSSHPGIGATGGGRAAVQVVFDDLVLDFEKVAEKKSSNFFLLV